MKRRAAAGIGSMSAERQRSIVITGATKGIGHGLANAFLSRGCAVTLCGRDPTAVEQTVADLGAAHAPERVAGRACDVAVHADVAALWDLAERRFGRVDVWINNAGTSNPQKSFAELAPSQIDAVVRANLVGTMNGAHVALAGMRRQGKGALYNMEGYGSDGSRARGMSVYGSTKVAVRYLTRSLAAEMRGTGVQVCALSPGVVVTELLVSVYAEGDPDLWKRQRWLFKFIADPVEVVCPWLADAVLANRRTDARLAWMTIPKAIGRFFLPRYHRRDLFPSMTA
jgi:NAD(P)-dependent dehydrogenase (short-subunit alcohol dehydrogenase family)